MNKIFIKTYGCSVNTSDSESIAGVLSEAGFKLVKDEDSAELVIVNTCIVKMPTQQNILNYIKGLKEQGKSIVVTGCMPQAIPEELAGYSMLGIDQIGSIVEVVEETLAGNSVALIAREKNPRLNLPIVRRNEIVEIIPVSSGCLGSCSYCIVKRARGDLMSYDLDAIVNRVDRAVRRGAKEIWLTAQDMGCYGKDIGSSLPELLKKVIEVPGQYLVRVGMMNPDYALEHIDELVEIFQSKKVFKFIHIPIQSGNNNVLKNMNRKYTVEDYKKVVEILKEKVPKITIATDVICGFPEETEEEFNDTLELVKETKPVIVNISRYWNRPHTKAAEMKQFRGDVTKNRSRQMKSTFEWVAFDENKKWKNWEGVVLVDEKGPEGTNSWVARNSSYKPIILEGKYFLGDRVKVRIIRTTTYDLRAIPI